MEQSPELIAIQEFLLTCIPFDELKEDTINRLLADIEISYHRKGTVFAKEHLKDGLRIVRSGAAELRSASDMLLDRLAEGDSFNLAGLNFEQPGIKAILIEDALIYTLPEKSYQQLRSDNRFFDRFFSSQRSRRVRRAARYESSPHDMMRDVSSVMSEAVLSVPPSSSIQQTAKIMSEARISSVLIMEDENLAGIVTDRDIRSRAVAENIDLQTSVASIMTADPYTLTPESSIFDTTLFMTQHGIHHIPIVSADQVKGIVTASDLMLAKKDDPVFLVQHISRQQNIGGLKGVIKSIPDLLVQWVNSGIRAAQLSHVLTALSDAITVRLIELTVDEIGPAPVPFCWLGFGSQGRKEQLLGADQDNGLVISDQLKAEHEPWFKDLANRVCDGLNECGYVYCPGDIMASNAQWRQPLQAWKKTVDKWTRSPTEKAVMHVSIFFDIRAIYGDKELAKQLQHFMLEKSRNSSIFLAALAQNALTNPPPMGIFRRFVVEQNGEHRNELNLKKRGVIPIVDIARLHALANGVDKVNTMDRLQALADKKVMTIEDSRNMQDALMLIMQLRVKHQALQIIGGEETDNYINPGDLSKLRQKQIKDAFAIVKDAQQAIKLNYRQGMA